MDLTNPNNWSQLGTWALRGNLKAKYGQGTGALEIYDPIPSPIKTSLGTPVGLVRTLAPEDEIKPNWYKACRFNAYLTFPNTVSKDRIFSRVCGLNQGTFLQLPDFGVYPYRIEIDIPDYLISLYVQLWQFTSESGRYDQTNQTAILSALEVVEERQAQMQKQLEFVVNRDVATNYTVEIREEP